jgi:phosphomannomutase
VEALTSHLLEIIDKLIDEPYQKMVRSRLFRPDLIREEGAEVRIVYTPLHGTGAMHVEEALESLGLKVITVPEQRDGDGDFPTVSFPNPEEAAALDLALKLGKEKNADVVMATDPDADRLGIAVPSNLSSTTSTNSGFTLLSGNQLGVLLADYIFLSLKETGNLPANAAMVNSIVTTGMQKRVAESYGAKCLECLTGFKWIADIMRKCDSGELDNTVVFGTEESYGYLVENEVRDKDGVSAAALTAEMTLYWRSKGRSLLDRLDELYKANGFWKEIGISKYFQGSEGPAIMKGIMAEYRKNPPKTLGGIEVVKVRDIQESVWKYPANPGKTESVDLPKSDVLQFYLEDGTVVSARPSGTEPKIKFYASCCAEVGPAGIAAARAEVEQKLNAISKDIRQVIDPPKKPAKAAAKKAAPKPEKAKVPAAVKKTAAKKATAKTDVKKTPAKTMAKAAAKPEKAKKATAKTAVPKKTAAKPAAKKAVAKKTAVKASAVKKPAAKKAPAKKAVAKKTVVKASAVKKATAKTIAKKAAPRKTAVKAVAVKKPVAKKDAAKKATAKAPVKKPVAKKTAVKASAVKKPAAKKDAAKKATAKTIAKKAAPRKTAVKKVTVKAPAKKAKVPAKKAPAKKRQGK